MQKKLTYGFDTDKLSFMALTKKQKQVYDYIYYYIKDNSYAPTQSEIKEYFGFKSLGSVQDYIRYLTQAEYIRNDSNAVRGIETLVPLENNIQPIKTTPDIIALPLLGSVAAGLPIEKYEDNQTVDIPAHLVGNGEHYALKVQGSSMIEDGIFDGDIVILKHQENAYNGQTAVVMVDGAATIKKFYKEANHLKLVPANETMEPIIVTHSNWKVTGVLVSLFRQYL